MTRSKDDQRLAFDAFYRRHKEYFFGICYSVANRYKSGAFDHEDLFQETMLRVQKHAHTFCPDGITDAQELEDKAMHGLAASQRTLQLI